MTPEYGYASMQIRGAKEPKGLGPAALMAAPRETLTAHEIATLGAEGDVIGTLGGGLIDSRAVGDWPFWAQQNDAARSIRRAEHQYLALKTCDSLWWEVDHADDLRADQALRRIEIDDLRARALGAARFAEVDGQLVRGFSGLRKLLDVDDGADAHLDCLERGVIDHQSEPSATST